MSSAHSRPPGAAPKTANADAAAARTVASRSTMRGTLISFAAVLGVALPYFIWAKRTNDAKKRERHLAARGGALTRMSAGEDNV
ncbi:hypothetical protein ACM66B_000814 [Microbotryomycetes sp. NB124-2]